MSVFCGLVFARSFLEVKSTERAEEDTYNDVNATIARRDVRRDYIPCFIVLYDLESLGCRHDGVAVGLLELASAKLGEAGWKCGVDLSDFMRLCFLHSRAYVSLTRVLVLFSR